MHYIPSFVFLSSMVNAAGAIITLLLLVLLAFFFVYGPINMRTSRTLKEKAAAQEIETAVLKARLEMQEQTFKELSKEVHDNLGQKLSVVKFNVVLSQINKTPVAPETAGIISDVISSLRDLSRSLRAERVENEGLISSLNHELALLEKTGAFKTDLQIHGTSFFADAETELIIYRICQEALQNIIRHSGATTIDIVMKYSPAFLELSIADNGSGKIPPVMTGMGIRNMQMRAQMLGGTCRIESSPEGCTVRLLTPIQEEVFEKENLQTS